VERIAIGAVAVLLGAGCAQARQAGAVPASSAAAVVAPVQDYLFFVASEGNDEVALVRFGPGGAAVVRKHRIGTNPTELKGPHGVAVAPDGRSYYVTTGHGMPNGALWQFSTENDAQTGYTELGLFPATLQVTPTGHYIWAVNFNLYGDMVPSSVSVVYAEDMLEVKRIPTCVMPHGSRLSPDGQRHYSACMMSDMLIEIDVNRLSVSRHFMLRKGSEHGMDGPPGAMGMRHGSGEHGMGPGMAEPDCSPAWAQPSADGRTVWVACNKSNDLVEVDAASWSLRRRLPAGEGVYNLATTRDGRLLVATNKRGQSVSVFETASGRELARIPSTRRVPSGVVITPDDRYALVTLEGVGSEPGTVDIIDLAVRARVASVDVGQQAGGIDFWKTVTVRP
jgi:DNA-binding beta-propeller fold protein YncE